MANPYDCCVMNKTVNGKQLTTLWHVDDLKISHVDSEVNESVVKVLSAWYGTETPMTVNRGNIHNYLGMTLDYSTCRKVSMRMDNYFEGMLEEVPDGMSGTASTPAAAHLLKVSDNTDKLSSDDANLFHWTTAKMLFLCKQARPNIQTAVAFLCTRVQVPDVDDYKKLHRVVQYLSGTKLMLEADDLQALQWWVDASFTVHWDMKSHTGGCFRFGKGAVYLTSL